MVEPDGSQTPARGRVQTWRPNWRPGSIPEILADRVGGAPVWPIRLPEVAGSGLAAVKRWIAAEIAPGRLFAWLPVGYGFGVILYFTADREPTWTAAAGLALGCAAVAVIARRRALAFVMLMAAAAVSAGFATGTIRTALIAHPVLQRHVGTVRLTGFIEAREERERTDRFILRVEDFDGARVEEKPERVRLSVRRGKAPHVGAFVELRARLDPPRQPLRPGSYDLARDLYFQRIGASGMVSGEIKEIPAARAPSLWMRYAASIEALRDAIDAHIRAALPGDPGSIASALITGKHDAISAAVFDAMFVSGLGHVLSISGYHVDNCVTNNQEASRLLI